MTARPVDLPAQMLLLLGARSGGSPITIAEFARTCGADRELIALHAQRLVDSGAATGAHVHRKGRTTLHALFPPPVAPGERDEA